MSKKLSFWCKSSNLEFSLLIGALFVWVNSIALLPLISKNCCGWLCLNVVSLLIDLLSWIKSVSLGCLNSVKPLALVFWKKSWPWLTINPSGFSLNMLIRGVFWDCLSWATSFSLARVLLAATLIACRSLLTVRLFVIDVCRCISRESLFCSLLSLLVGDDFTGFVTTARDSPKTSREPPVLPLSSENPVLFMFAKFDLLVNNGVKIVRTPSDESYGRVLVFSDLYGNLWDLIEPKTKRLD